MKLCLVCGRKDAKETTLAAGIGGGIFVVDLCADCGSDSFRLAEALRRAKARR